MTQFITYNSLKTYVEQHIGEWIVKKILREIKLTKDELWGLVKTRSWAAKTIYVTLYHDLENPSYLSLTNRVVRFYKLTSRSLKRNVHYCRHKLKAWGKSVCTVVPSSTLQKNGIMFHSHYFTGKVTLWTDTTDIRVTGKDRMSRYDPNYSYKVSGPGRKFLTIHDAQMRSIFCFGPFGPKTYDSDIMLIYMKKIEKLYPRQVIIGDGHFTVAARMFKKTRIITNFVRSGRPTIVNGEKIGRMLTPHQSKHNQNIIKIRGRVESPYGYLKTKFKSLNTIFRESDKQLKCVLVYTLAIHRLVLKK